MSLMSSLCFVATCECTLFCLKMAANIINKIVLQDELPIILTVEIPHQTQIKGHHVYKDKWATELCEHLGVQCDPENSADKYAVCLKTSNGTIVGHSKKGKSGHFANTIFYYLRSHPRANCTAKVTCKRFNLGDGEGLQVPCILQFTAERKFISVLKEQFNLLKEKK